MGLRDQINVLREELYKLICNSSDLNSKKILECSQNLDKLIVQYQLQVQKINFTNKHTFSYM